MPTPVNPGRSPLESRLRSTFRDADRNADGALSKEEARAQLERAGVPGLDGAAVDRFDANGDGSLSLAEARSLAATPAGQTALERLSSADPLSLAGRLDRALPEGRFDYPWQRERVLERAAGFENEARQLASGAADPQSSLGRLRGSLGPGFDANADIELHGVASHFAPETLQAHVKDRAGKDHVFTRDGEGNWVERQDLANKSARGQIPSMAPGMRRDRAGGTATFGVATVKANGDVDFRVPDVSRFDHAPRARPFAVGDTVQLSRSTGEAKVAEEGKPYVRNKEVRFGRITGTDGRGNWSIQETNPDGSVKNGDDGKPLAAVSMSDATLRRTNNPTVLRDGVRVYDARFLPNDPAQKRMMDDWHASDAYQELDRTRPAPNAPAAEKAAWERRAIDASDAWLHERMEYPDSQEDIAGLKEERAALAAEESPDQGRLDELDARIQKGERYWAMTNQSPPPSIGDYYANGTGQCRQQAIAGQTLLQDLGIDARMTRGAANTDTGNYRGEHMWLEAQLSDGSQMLVDPTWSSPGSRPGELRTPYDGDLRRLEDPNDTERDYRLHLTSLTPSSVPAWQLGRRIMA